MSWKKCRGSGISIAILDSGVDIERNEFSQSKIITINNCKDTLGHGTAITSLITKNVPDASLYVYNLFAEKKDVDVEYLTDTLEQITSTMHFDIIHLSCGVTVCDDIAALYKICKKIVDNGTIIVSAFDNEGTVSYPAVFDNVIGVDWNPFCVDGMKYYAVEGSPINIMGLGSLQRLPWVNGTYKYVAGSSFAAPYITSIVAKMLESGTKPSQITSELYKNASKTIQVNNSSFNPQKYNLTIKKAIVLPFNKEIQTLILHEESLNFDICGLYDFPIFRSVGKKCSEALQFGTSERKIESVNNINWEDDFDTVILGHLGVISAAIGKDMLKEILEKCSIYRKNIYAFDDLRPYEKIINTIQTNNHFVFFPKTDVHDIDNSLMGKLYTIGTPTLAVFGTSSKQGKFTLQLFLRKEFQKLGYNIGSLGTEPTSLLFDMDMVYPMGYGGIRLSGADAIQTINRYMHEIDNKNYDLIIVGSQSQTIPYNNGNVGHYPIAQHEFFIATNPDAVILCINPFDDILYVKRTLAYLENYLYSKVIGLVIFPKHREMEWDIQGFRTQTLDEQALFERRLFYSNKLNKPCYLLGNPEEMNLMIHDILNYFTD